MYMQRTTSGAAGYGLYTTIKYIRGASGIGMGTTIKNLRCTTIGAAGNGLGATIGTANNGMSTTIIPPCIVASFEEELRAPHRGTSLGPFVCVTPIHLANCRSCTGLMVAYAPANCRSCTCELSPIHLANCFPSNCKLSLMHLAN